MLIYVFLSHLGQILVRKRFMVLRVKIQDNTKIISDHYDKLRSLVINKEFNEKKFK